MSSYETVIGLEVHVQLKTASKIFCSCPVKFDSPPNTNICPVCCGYPGVLPVFNQQVLGLALRVCLALNCSINRTIYFERKNYFYPDLPKNFQISQYKLPLGHDGFLELPRGKKIRIHRVHMEEDAGKLIHQADHSLVDFNRTGTPLLEIVSEPDLSGPQEAFDYLTNLKLILMYISASDCDMEKGSLRCDANISLRQKGVSVLGTKVELKNMNTFRGVRAALEFEAERQKRLLDKGESILQETRLWDADELKTVLMRTKEAAHDYRYFPEPDLPDFSVRDEHIEQEKSYIGEFPLARKKRFLTDYQFQEKEADVYVSSPWLSDFFEKVLKKYPRPKEVSNWVLGPFLEQVNSLDDKFDSVKISPHNFAKIVQYFSEGRMNNLAAKKALSLSIATDEDIDSIMEREKLAQVSSQDQLEGYVEEVVKENPKAIQEFLEGKHQAIQFLVGQIMKKTKGKANPKIAREMLERRLKE
jgi:aspartyl-tRNA(Asn)/glutamyl-tRNA(Gln) amidotransferase subunit B